ncbi:MAG: leucyl/phenylalanyl-tRNA--protein transferase [Gammaproteobacteria bacterium]|nr:leucyl/phenylalanyl-tRNA--protein transferase [Gammaproteobacteria bacterium]
MNVTSNIDDAASRYAFPDAGSALEDPNGLLAVGGDLNPARLVAAYRRGIFPWYSEGEPVLWWSPAPRAVLFPEKLKISRSLRKTLRRNRYRVTMDHAFRQVMSYCAAARKDQEGTWITVDMIDAYCQLHALGFAHSVEAWYDDELVGGLYGVALGRLFFGESMFHRQRDASKVAFAHLVRQLMRWGYPVIDCQVNSPHLISLGAEEVSRDNFSRLLERWRDEAGRPGLWQCSLTFDW